MVIKLTNFQFLSKRVEFTQKNEHHAPYTVPYLWIDQPSKTMDYRQTHLNTPALASLYMDNRYKSILEQTKAFQLLENSRKEIDNVLSSASLLISDLAKRLYINQLKMNEYAISLAKYEDVNLIQNKYEKLPELEDSVLYQLVTNGMSNNHTEQVIEDTNDTPPTNFDNNYQAISENDFFQQFNVKEEADTYQQSEFLNDSPIQIQTVAKSKPVSLKSFKKNKKLDYPTNGMFSNFTKKRSKGYEIIPQTKLEMERLQALPQSEKGGKKIAISLDKDLKQEKKRRQEQSDKQQRKARIKEESDYVGHFVHSYLVAHLKYSDDHKNYLVAKKTILNLYLRWCKGINRQVLFPQQMSIIQMFLTNELKICFNRIDVYSNNYKGLILIGLPTCPNEYESNNTKSKKKGPAQLPPSNTVDIDKQNDLNLFQDE